MDAEPIEWEHCTARTLMQKTLQESLLTPRTTRSIKNQLLRDPATVRDIAEFIEKAVTTSVKTSATNKLSEGTSNRQCLQVSLTARSRLR